MKPNETGGGSKSETTKNDSLKSEGPFSDGDTATRVAQLKTQLLCLFAPGEVVESRFIAQPSGAVTQTWHKLGYEFAETAAQMLDYSDKMGRSVNSYVGRAPRARYGGRAYDVDTVRTHSFDVDARRDEAEGKTASEKSLEDSRQVAKLIVTKLSDPNGITVHSGNGRQVIVRFDEEIDCRGRRAWLASAIQQWEEWVLKDVPTLTTVIDPQFDVPRVIKMVGSFSHKGGQHRPVYIESVRKGAPVPIGNALDSADAQKQDDELAIQKGTIPSKFWTDLNADARLRAAWLGELVDLKDKSGSGHDMSLVAQLRIKRYSPEECKAIIFACPAGKKKLTEKYVDLTIRKAFGI